MNRTDPCFSRDMSVSVHLATLVPTRRRGDLGSWPAVSEGVSKHGRREITQVRAAWIEAGSPGPGSQQSGRPEGLRSPESKHGYRHAMNSFSGIAPSLSFNKIVANRRHRIFVENCDLAARTINRRPCAVATAGLMRLRMLACSAPNSSQVPDV